MSATSAQTSHAPSAVTGLVYAFIAGVLAVPVFHQIALWILHVAGIIPFAPFDMSPTKPLGVPALISISFWGGVWGVVFALTVRRWFSGITYWIAALVGGGIVLTLVFIFVVVPLKSGGHLPAPLVGFFIIGFLLNAAWGIGWALFLALIERVRGAA
jgi:hypothetical protein